MSAPNAFRSVLTPHIDRFLRHHRALGKRFDTEESALLTLLSALQPTLNHTLLF